MKKRTRILILGIAMMFIMAMSGCGVNHKSPEGVVEALIKNYVSGREEGEAVLFSGKGYQ